MLVPPPNFPLTTRPASLKDMQMSETAPETVTDTKNSAPKRPSTLLDVAAEWLLYVSAALVIVGITQPSIMKPNTIGLNVEYNLFGIVHTLFEASLPFLGVIVILFSGVFPLSKTILAAIIFRRGAPASPVMAKWLNILGKWSMLDVFLAAILIGLSQTMAYVGFFPRIGLYFFTAGVVLNNLATMRLSFSRWAPAPR